MPSPLRGSWRLTRDGTGLTPLQAATKAGQRHAALLLLQEQLRWEQVTAAKAAAEQRRQERERRREQRERQQEWEEAASLLQQARQGQPRRLDKLETYKEHSRKQQVRLSCWVAPCSRPCSSRRPASCKQCLVRSTMQELQATTHKLRLATIKREAGPEAGGGCPCRARGARAA